MKRTICLLFACVLLCSPDRVFAQNPTGRELLPMLQTLSRAQKLKLLDYLRHLGSDLDREVQGAYDQVDAAAQAKALRYIALLQQEGARPDRTTVRWNRDTIGFGRVEAGFIVLDSVAVLNTGDAPYVITDIRTACECAVLGRPDFPLMPGESATLRILFDSKGRQGPMVAGIVIYDNSSPNLRNILYLKGEILPRKPKTGKG